MFSRCKLSLGRFTSIHACVATWGDADHNRGSSASRKKLQDVQQIQAYQIAFAPILIDASALASEAPRHGDETPRQLPTAGRFRVAGPSTLHPSAQDP